jgi:copper resistance protein B
VGAGVSDIELGLRLRYEIEREFAPYIGINWERKLGRTSDFARDEGEDDNVFSVVVGLRIFF